MLCDRLGIFVDGTLVCIGNPKELTSRYGGYYIFTITTPPHQDAAAHALVLGMSPGARLTYALAGTRKYELPVGEVTLPGKQGGSIDVSRPPLLHPCIGCVENVWGMGAAAEALKLHRRSLEVQGCPGGLGATGWTHASMFAARLPVCTQMCLL